MASHDLYDVMSTLRAVRRLRPDPIPAEVLDRVLQAACWAPTGGNMQPWRIIVVHSPEHKQALADVYGPEWTRYAEFSRRRAERHDLTDDDRAKLGRTLAAGDYLGEHLAEAPVILLFVADPSMMAITDKDLDRISMVGGGSVYTAVQNAMLACRAEGLGCTLTTLHCLREPDVKAALGIPEEWATLALVPIGFPVGGGHGPITRRPPSELVFDDAFGVTWTGLGRE
jgi:nitroreductase